MADILHMAEMIFLTYIVGYLQVFLLWNFDEADKLGKKEVLGIVICTAIYVCVYFVYKCRRKIDDKILNSDLEMFKTRSEKE